MAAKRIKIIGGYEIQFDQRARGQETPFYVGRIFKNGVHVGGFENGGTGGPTLIHPPFVSKDFEKMFDDAAKKTGTDVSKMFEREAEVIGFAESYGYSKAKFSVTVEELWEDWVKQTIEEYKKYSL